MSQNVSRSYFKLGLGLKHATGWKDGLLEELEKGLWITCGCERTSGCQSGCEKAVGGIPKNGNPVGDDACKAISCCISICKQTRLSSVICNPNSLKHGSHHSRQDTRFSSTTSPCMCVPKSAP